MNIGVPQYLNTSQRRRRCSSRPIEREKKSNKCEVRRSLYYIIIFNNATLVGWIDCGGEGGGEKSSNGNILGDIGQT